VCWHNREKNTHLPNRAEMKENAPSGKKLVMRRHAN
jgi:hypothetical protein